MSDLSQRVANLSPAKLELLAQRLRKEGRGAAPAQAVPRRGAGAQHLPLSFAQERLWFLEQLEPGGTTYHLYPAYRLRGALQVEALEQSLCEIVRRHEALRTCFVAEDGRAFQSIEPPRAVELPFADLCGLDAEEREREVRRLAFEHARRPFDLARGPLLRAKLLRLAEQEHVLLFAIHHIISDGWSMGVLFREVAALYGAFSEGQPSPLPELPVQYADFALWQRERLAGEALEAHLSYWKGRLAGAAPTLELTTDRPRPASPGHHGATLRATLSPALTARLKELGRERGVTLFMLLLAAFKALLFRYTGQDDILVGTPVAGRTRPELEQLIGCFVNTLVLRTDLSGGPTFGELLQRVREVTLEAYAHQELPFEKLVDEVQPERNLSSSPLFQVMFDFHAAPTMAFELPGLALGYLPIERETAAFDLALSVTDAASGLLLSLTYKTELFEAATAEQMLRRMTTLLEGVAAEPDAAVAELPLFDEDERRELMSELSTGPAVEWEHDRCVHALFEEQVERDPAAAAVIFDEERMSYGELNRRANRLARHLRALGVGPGVCVGLCVERSPEIVTGLLAILKAGGVYVPLDSSYPAERLAFMVEDTKMSVLLTSGASAAELPSLAEGVRVIRTDADAEAIDGQSDENPGGGATADDLAYVIYTSGSTGRPKGVLITHRMCVNHCLDMQRHLRIGPADRVLQFASINFDVSLEQILPTLIGGAAVVLRDAEVWGAADFYRRLRAAGVTVANPPTAYWHEVVREGSREPGLMEGQPLKLMMPGGEAVQPEAVRLWRQSPLGGVRLLNAYGPTETTMTATTFELPLRAEEDAPSGRIPIGRPLANRTFYILDKVGNLAPKGVPGELYIGGPLLAWGYLNRPALTAERFVPDHIGHAPGARLYRTGDLARFLPGGELEFIGRADNQVKVRGFRIEPEEIELALAGHASVQACAVRVREDAPGEKRLVAYVVPQAGHAFDTVELRRHLGQRVPSYMMPSAFVRLEQLPLTPNGKVNHRALPAPEQDARAEGFGHVAPRTPAEEALAAIWSEVLGVERVGVEDNFFELGGDSILGIQIIARANRAGLKLTPKQLFQFQTVAQLAAAAGAAPVARAEQGIVHGAVPLTPVQRWFFERELADPHHFNQSFLFDLPEEIRPDLLERAAAHLLRHHDALRMRFVREAAGWRQFNAGDDEAVAFERVDLSGVGAEERRARTREKGSEVQAGFDLERGPLVRFALFDYGAAEPKRLLIACHHLVVDGVSWRVLLEDLQGSYEQLARGVEPELPAKTTSFKQWAERLSEYASGQEVEAEAVYWRDVSRNAARGLPLDFHGGSNAAGSARAWRVSLDEEETRRLLQEVPRAYNTQINDVLLAALALSYREWAGEEELLIDLEGHGREEIFEDVDLTRTVGWFTTIFPVRLAVAEAGRTAATLKQVKEHLRAIPGRGIGYGLNRYLGRGGWGSDWPEGGAGVSFNYLGQLDQSLAGSALFRLSPEACGDSCSPRNERSHLIDIIAVVVRGRLQISWTYSENLHQRETIEGWAQSYLGALRGLIEHCVSPEAGGFTPSDFPEAGLSAGELEDLLGELGG